MYIRGIENNKLVVSQLLKSCDREGERVTQSFNFGMMHASKAVLHQPKIKMIYEKAR